jgi:hypothetical protein
MLDRISLLLKVVDRCPRSFAIGAVRLVPFLSLDRVDESFYSRLGWMDGVLGHMVRLR